MRAAGSLRWRLTNDLTVECAATGALPAAIDAVYGSMRDERGDRKGGRIVPLRLDASGDDWRLIVSDIPVVSGHGLTMLAPVIEGSLLGHAVRSNRDALVLHAAVVSLANQTIVFVGSKGSGKSTLSALFGNKGAPYYGDEAAFIRCEDRKIAAFPKAATIKRGSFPLFPESPEFIDRIRGTIRYVLPASAAPGVADSPSMLIFPRYDPEASGEIMLLTEREAAFLLVQQTFGGIERHPRSLEVIQWLASLPCCSLAFSSFEEVEHILVSVLANQAAS